MASFFDQAPLYDNSRSTGSIRDLLLMQGEQKAQAARQAGDNWARTIGGIGNAVAGGVAAYGEHKAEQKQQAQMQARDAAATDFVTNWKGDDPKELYTGLMKIGGPEYAKKYGDAAMAMHSKPTEDAKTELQGMYVSLKALEDMPDEMAGPAFEGIKARYGAQAVKKGVVPPQLLEGPWTPEHKQGVSAMTNALGDVLQIKREPKAPRGTMMKVAGPDGKPLMRLVSDEEAAKGVTPFIEPEKAMKAEHVDLGDSVGILDAQGNVVRKIPKGVSPGSVGQGAGGDTAEEIAQAIIRGEQPPDMKALYKYGAPVRAILAKNGYRMAEAQADWQATQRHVATMNGPKFQGMVTAIDTASEALDQIDMLAKQWDAGGFKDLNRAQLGAAKKGLLGPEAAKIATALEAQITDVTSELGQVYQGGNSPTDHALQLAGKNLSADWSKDVLLSMTDLARKNIQIRKNSIRNSRPMGTGDNPYSPQAAPAAAAPSAPAGLPRAGSKAEYDAIPAGAMYVGSDGQVRKKGS